MATREKKLSITRKQTASSPIPSTSASLLSAQKDDQIINTTTTPPTITSLNQNENETNQDDNESNEIIDSNEETITEASSSATPTKLIATKNSALTRKFAARTVVTRKKKSSIKIKLKASSASKMKKGGPIKPKLIKSIITKNNVDPKKKLLKTCKQQQQQVKSVRKTRLLKANEEKQLPPVLMPITAEDSNDGKLKKKPGRPPRIIDNKKAATNVENDSSSPPVENEQIKSKRIYRRKIKTEPQTPSNTSDETIDDVMNDLTSLIKSGDEQRQISADSKRSGVLTTRRKNIENRLSKLSASERKVIDMLDLNVRKFQKGMVVTTRRRHSIEKFPIGSEQQQTSAIFTNLPRCISPRSTKLRFKRSTAATSTPTSATATNPYKMRSDTPARILRNGKHRKLKDIQLLDGLEPMSGKRRRRNCSEFSGSELSKLSGYESDSSFSDMSSVNEGAGGNNKDNTLDAIKIESKENFEANINDDFKIKSINNSLPDDDKFGDDKEEKNFTDTNSNLCPLKNEQEKKMEESIKTECEQQEVAENNSNLITVPEKSLILDIMKQTFNEIVVEENKEKSNNNKSEPLNNEESCGDNHKTNEIKDELTIDPKTDEDQELTIITQNGTNDVEKEEAAAPTLKNGHCNAEETVEKSKIEETPENLAIKENILQALGLQSLKAAKEAKLSREKSEIVVNKSNNINGSDNTYTGTLKTVIKINRGGASSSAGSNVASGDGKKKGRAAGMKMTLHKNRNRGEVDGNGVEDGGYRVIKDGPSTSGSWKNSGQSSDTAGAHRKSHYSNRSNMDGSSEHTSDGETAQEQKALVIPEKASSFSIHPGRLCQDVCAYCFGKFGLFDTPCHIAQMKSAERQNKILAAEKHLTTDSCLCDACYRHVDRKANTPSYTSKSYKRSAIATAPGPREDHCHVFGCDKASSNILRRKWVIKMRKSICQVMSIDLDNPGLHSIPVCDQHYTALEHLMVCAMCKRRLAKNHFHYLGPETNDLNSALQLEGVPLKLNDKPVVCKLCKCFAAIILKNPEDRVENSVNFLREYKKRLLHFNDIVPMDEAAAEEPIVVPSKERSEVNQQKMMAKKRKLATKQQSAPNDNDKSDQSRVPSTDTNQSRPESPSDYMVDYNTLIPTIAMECGSDSESAKTNLPAPKLKKISRQQQQPPFESTNNKRVKLNDKSSDIAVQRLGSNPSISVRQLFPCEEDLALQGHIDFGNVKERTPEGWEKCTSVIQYDMETKHLWHELQKPYGNQSSFLRHLILLEKYFRNGDLILASNPSHHSINYTESVHNRLKAYDNIPSLISNLQSVTLLPCSKSQKSSSGIITSTNASMNNNSKEIVPPIINAANIPKNTPLTISQLNSPPLIQPASNNALSLQQQQSNKQKSVGAPPGLISLLPGTNKPVAPIATPNSTSNQANAKPQSQKIKFPITKNWRPNLIPIDPAKKDSERKAGLVQVISGGKPFHITLDDYKKMCAIKKSFEMRQKKRQQEQQQQQMNNKQGGNYNSVLKQMAPRKGLVISKTTNSSNKSNNELQESVGENSVKELEQLNARLSDGNKSVASTSATTSFANHTTTTTQQITTAPTTATTSTSSLSLPKIPKSLTVIPQTVTRKPSRPSSPVLLITTKPKQINNKS